MGAVAPKLTEGQLRWFAGVYKSVQGGSRVLSLGISFPNEQRLKGSAPWWWLRYFRITVMTHSYHGYSSDRQYSWGSWEPTAEGIRLATRLRLQGKL